MRIERFNNGAVILGDGVEVMRKLPDCSIDLVVTSPPYDQLRKYNGYNFDFESTAYQMHRVLKKGGCVIWVVGDSTINGSESCTSFRQALFFREIGFGLHDTMLYQKENYIPLTHNRYEQCWEYIFCFSKGRPKTFNPIQIPAKTAETAMNLKRKGYAASVIEGAQRRRDEIRVVKDTKYHSNIFLYPCGSSRVKHPAPFPEQLAADQIISWSNPGETVLDPFFGSGTTGKAATLLDRQFIGVEISEQYFDVACDRLKNV